MLEIRTFGGLQLASGGNPITDLASRKAEALLVYLAVTGRPQPREVLADIFWDERTQTQAMANLRTVLSSLRKNLGEYVEISRDYAAIRTDAEIWLDLSEFEQRLGAARLDEAISLYRGDFLEGFHIRDSIRFDDWISQERQRCLKSLQDGLHDWVRYHTERGSYQEGIAYAEQLLVIDPLDEEAICQLMQLLSLSGQRPAALKRYEDFSRTLDQELGVAPSPIALDIQHQIISGDFQDDLNSLAHRPRETRVVGECPYRGLAPFREVDAPFFYGREDFTQKLKNAVKNGSVVTVVVGASGSGKSSAMYAGLFPALRKNGRWAIMNVRPGRQPFENLAGEIVLLRHSGTSEAERLELSSKLAFHMQHEPGRLARELKNILASNGSADRLLLAVDQFEELYTQCLEIEVQRRFLDELLTAVSGNPKNDGSIVLLQTLRADFMGQALAYRPFADVLQNAALMLGPMNRGELRSVVVQPAEKQGAAFEPGLVERILNDVGDEPGNLPLLEFSLTLLWDRLDQGWLTHAAYEEIGQVAGALTRYAEEVFAALSADQQVQAQRLFTQLVQPGDGAEDTRRVATREELAGCEWSLIQYLADKRLVVTGLDQEGDETVEVVHEALIRNWGRLKNWMEQDRAFRSWQEGLRAACRQWGANQEDEGGLLRGRPLAQAESWLEERLAELSESDVRFIQSGIELRDRREKERAQRRRRIFTGLAAGLVITLVLAVFSFIQRNQAQESYSMSMAAHVQNALDNHEVDLALGLALSAAEVNNPPPFVERMLRQAAYSPGPIKGIDNFEAFGMDQMPFSMAVSPVDFVSLIGFHDGTLILWDVMEGKEIRRFEGHTDVIADVAFSPDGKTALSGSYDKAVILWDLETGKILTKFNGHNGWVRAVTFSPDGSLVATGGFSGTEATDVSNPGELILWNPETGEEIMRLEGHPSALQDIEFSPDGSKLLASSGFFAAISNQASMYYWDLETGEIIHRFDLDYDAYDVAISPDGSAAISVSLDQINSWDLTTGKHVSSASGFFGMPRSLAVSPSGDQVITIDSNGRVILFDFPSWEISMQAYIHRHEGGDWSDSRIAMARIALSPDGRYAVSIAFDNIFLIWDLRHAGELRRFEGHESEIGAVAISPDGKKILSGSGSFCFCDLPGQDNTVRLWDAESGEQIYKLEGHTNLVTMTDMTPDGKVGISGSLDGTARVWNLETGEQITMIENAHTGGLFSAVISPDGTLALTGSVTGDTFPDSDGVKLWDLETGEMLHYYNDGDQNSTKIIFSPDGKSAYASLNELTYLDFETGDLVIHPSEVPTCCVGFAISSDQKVCYSVRNDDTILRAWDIETGEIIQEYGAHGGNRSRVELSKDDKVLFSSSGWYSLYLWDIPTGELLRTWDVGGVNLDIDMTPDGKLAVSQGPNNSVVLSNLDLPIELDDVLAWITKNRYVRELTCEERATYSITPLCDAGTP